MRIWEELWKNGIIIGLGMGNNGMRVGQELDESEIRMVENWITIE